MVKNIFILFVILSGSLSGQDRKGPPSFMLTDKDTIGHLRCSQEDLDTLISMFKRNLKCVIDAGMEVKADISFEVDEDFRVFISDEIVDHVSGKAKGVDAFKEKISEYYKKEARRLALQTAGLWVPTRVKGKYRSTKFKISIDFTGDELDMKGNEDYVLKFDDVVLSDRTTEAKKKLSYYGLKYLKQKDFAMAMIYLKQDVMSNKNGESATLAGNIWEYSGELDTACYYWKKAAEYGSESAKSKLSKCN